MRSNYRALTSSVLTLVLVLVAITTPAQQGERRLPSGVASVQAQGTARVEGMPHGVFKIEKFKVRADGQTESKPYETLEHLNAYTNAGGSLLLDLLSGAGGTAFNAANAYLGVGDSSTATTASMTDLQASTNKLRVAMDATYPSRSGQVLTFKATFGSSSANYAWNEVAIFNASTGGTMLARSASSLGTKVSGTSWTLTYTITVP